MAFVEVRSLRKVYASEGTETVALQDISLNIEKGEFVAIMGPSGSGKSTLLQILGFLERYTSGTYMFDGKEMSRYTEDQLAHIRNRKMGFVFQAFNLLSRTSVIENVKLPLLYSDVPESQWQKRATEAVEAVGLMHRIHHHPAQLSGGEKQRAAIARALVMRPQIIFADEPTGNLDSRSGGIVMKTLEELHVEHRHTIVLVTHETYTAESAERIIRLHDGLVQSDQTVERRRNVKERFIK
jgi:putative ABC transport system ATP-binding protein